jgi:hypothetical protein
MEGKKLNNDVYVNECKFTPKNIYIDQNEIFLDIKVISFIK